MRHPIQAVRLLCLGFIAALVLFAVLPVQVRAAPLTTLTISDPHYGTAPTYVNAATAFTLSAVDSLSQPVSNIWYRWGNVSMTHNWTKYTGPFTATVEMPSTGGAPGLPIDLEGAWTLYYNATDSLGQSESTKSIQVYIDNSYPVTQIQYSGTTYSGSYLYIESGTMVTLAATDTGSGLAEIRYAINSDPENVYASPFTISGPGLSTICYYSVDNLDNTEPEKTATVFMDNDAPAVGIAAGTPQCSDSGSLYIAGTTTISLSVTDVSGVSASSYKVDSGSWADYTAPFAVTAEGLHTVTARATDMMGHASAETTLTFTVDSTAPIVTVVGAVGGAIETEYGASLTITCSDSGAGNCDIYYSIDSGVTWTLYSGPMLVIEDTVIQYYAEDSVGNRAAEATVHVWVDEQPSGFWTTELTIIWVSVCAICLAVIIISYRKLDKENEEDPDEKEGKKRKEKDDDEELTRKKKIKRNR